MLVYDNTLSPGHRRSEIHLPRQRRWQGKARVNLHGKARVQGAEANIAVTHVWVSFLDKMKCFIKLTNLLLFTCVHVTWHCRSGGFKFEEFDKSRRFYYLMRVVAHWKMLLLPISRRTKIVHPTLVSALKSIPPITSCRFFHCNLN